MKWILSLPTKLISSFKNLLKPKNNSRNRSERSPNTYAVFHAFRSEENRQKTAFRSEENWKKNSFPNLFLDEIYFACFLPLYSRGNLVRRAVYVLKFSTWLIISSLQDQFSLFRAVLFILFTLRNITLKNYAYSQAVATAKSFEHLK